MFVTWLDIKHPSPEGNNLDILYILLNTIYTTTNFNNSHISKEVIFNVKMPYPETPLGTRTVTIKDPRMVFYLPSHIKERIINSAITLSKEKKFSAVQKLLDVYRRKSSAIYYNTIRELLNACFATGMTITESYKQHCNILFFLDGNLGWTRAYVHISYKSSRSTIYEISCEKCSVYGWLDTYGDWNIYPTSNIIHVKHSDMSTVKEIPNCLTCYSNKYFIVSVLESR